MAGTDTPGPAALITDPRLLELWTSALGELASSRPVSSLPRVAAPAVPRGEDADDRNRGGLRLDTDEESWLAYTDDAKADLGPAMFHFVLGGFPGLRAFAGTADSGLREPTDKLVEERSPGSTRRRRGRRRRRHRPGRLSRVGRSPGTPATSPA